MPGKQTRVPAIQEHWKLPRKNRMSLSYQELVSS